MSPKNPSRIGSQSRAPALIFAALGDATRLRLVARLCGGELRSISDLTRGSRLTRQAITKHLSVLQNAGVVCRFRSGRHSLFKFHPQPIDALRDYLDFVSEQWDHALARLKSLVER